MKLSKRIQKVKPSATLELTALANRLKAQGVDIIGFGAGEPDFDTPLPIKEAAKKAIDSGKTKYTPAGGIKELKDAVMMKFKRDNGLDYRSSEVTVNCGGKHSFYNLMQVMIDEGDEVIIPVPYWVSYPSIVLLAGGTPVLVDCPEKSGFKMTPEQLKKSITGNTRVVIINSPSNPTGAAYTRTELEDLAAVVEGTDITVISDDIYESIVYDGFKFANMANISDSLKKQTIIMNSVSKTYSMTGWRIGYIAGNEAVIQGVETLQSQSTSNPTSIAQWAALNALTGDQSVLDEMLAAFIVRRKLIVEGLNSIPGVSCMYPDGAFYAFPRVSDVYDFPGWEAVKRTYGGGNNSSVLCSYLIDEARVAVVPGVEFGNDGHIRLSFATSDDNISRGLARIDDALRKLA
jgi:aspartate aminotransferase